MRARANSHTYTRVLNHTHTHIHIMMQGLADTITCGEGGTCLEDVYVDPCGNGFRLEVRT